MADTPQKLTAEDLGTGRRGKPTELLWGVRARPEREPVAEDDPARKLIGRVLDDRFSVTDVLGRGGMGVVYAGTDHVLDRPVVIKVIAPKTGRLGTAARLVREAQLACRVQHPSIVTVFHLGILDDSEPYVVMEQLKGTDVATLFAREGPMSLAATIDVLEPIADALDALHAQGIVHRDVKPENLFVLDGRRERPLVKLIDFGLAILDSGAMERLTRAGQIVGTAEYMAPESARGKSTPASDVYALASTAFELLTGRLPFEGKGIDLLIRKSKEEPLPLGELALDPAAQHAERALAAALHPDARERPSAVGLLAGMRAALSGAPRTSSERVLSVRGARQEMRTVAAAPPDELDEAPTTKRPGLALMPPTRGMDLPLVPSSHPTMPAPAKGANVEASAAASPPAGPGLRIVIASCVVSVVSLIVALAAIFAR